jgi:hypothetical protein
MQVYIFAEPQYRDIESAQEARLSTWKPYMELEKTKYDAFFATAQHLKPLYCESSSKQYMKTAFFYCLERVQQQGVVHIMARNSVKVTELLGPVKYWPAPSKFQITNGDMFKYEFREFFETKQSKLASNEKRAMTQREKNLHNKTLFQRWNQVLGFKMIGPHYYDVGFPKMSKITSGVLFVKKGHVEKLLSYAGVVGKSSTSNENTAEKDGKEGKSIIGMTAIGVDSCQDAASAEAVVASTKIMNPKEEMQFITQRPAETRNDGQTEAGTKNDGLELLCDVAMRIINKQ